MADSTDLLARYGRVFDMPECGWPDGNKIVSWFIKDEIAHGPPELRPPMLRICRDWLRERLVQSGCRIDECGAITEISEWTHAPIPSVRGTNYDQVLLQAAELQWEKEKT